MKKLFSLIIVISLTLPIFSGCSSQDINTNTSSEKFITKDELDAQLKSSNGFSLVFQNDYLELYVDGKTTEISVQDKRTDKIWYSNPKDRANDKIASGSNMDNLNSQIELECIDTTNQIIFMNNYTQSISLNQYEFCKINNGFRITYTIGDVEEIYLVPTVISEKRMDAFLSKMNSEDKEAIVTRYTLYSPNNMDITEKEVIKKLYPYLKNQVAYVLNAPIPDFIKTELSDIFIKANYTENDLAFDEKENNVPPTKKPQRFVVPIEYTLEKDNLIAKIPHINSPSNLKLTNIKLLSTFGAAGNDENGYIFVPDGCGALIELNNGKTQYKPYKKQLYGYDRTTDVKIIPNIEQQCFLPVFGIKQNNSAFLAIIEKGDAYANINACVSGKNNSYNTVFSSFTINVYNEVNSASWMRKTGINIYQSKPNDNPIQIKYTFLYNNDANYTGMALAYQNYLLDNGLIKTGSFKDNIPFMLSFLGAVDFDSSILGIPVKSIKPLTSYDESKKILELLKSSGISNISAKYLAWANNGVGNKIFSNVELIGELGGEKKFNELIDYSKQNGIDLYPEANFMYVTKNDLFDAFIARWDDSRFVTSEYAYTFFYALSTNRRIWNTKKFIIKPTKYHYFINSFINDYEKYNNPFLSVGILATDLNSDFDEKNITHRQEVKNIILNELDYLKSKGFSLVSDCANVYTLKNLTYINNMPMLSSDYYLMDKSIPFYQIVLHGIMPYSSTPINLEEDYKLSVLKALEIGASPSFEWTYAPNYDLKNTDYDYYSTYYLPWFDDAVKTYKQINAVLAQNQTSKIASHEQISNNVFKTSFENGNSIYVNYSDNEVTNNNLTIGAKSYLFVKGGEKIVK